ncbi:HSP20-like chaperone [Eremomyces bilateralis CBS 781.70]|uniref:HSP20-like chaperone n=1 Tax=Eremomyces bilateralis CBS 781.70 TaxID=1392243 RepID=A0A6G1G766_9PEZI|nr:HSP20-like chaperone [Eremomyces bilateralis CBS 781.70]KAF1813893.1 HSP20-like chaperone [Eremomyces bilateralis CBS 781.70]
MVDVPYIFPNQGVPAPHLPHIHLPHHNPHSLDYHPHSRPSARVPLFDLRESSKAYFLEGELAGVTDAGAVHIEWLDDRTLLVEAEGDKEHHEDVPVVEAAPAVATTGGLGEVRQWLHERHVGHHKRQFTFPVQVKHKGVSARLGGGLLRVVVPKQKEEPAKKVRKVIVLGLEGVEVGLRA